MFTLDDLGGASLRDFQRVSDYGTALFVEVGPLIEQAKRGDFASSPIRGRTLSPGSGRSVPLLKSVTNDTSNAPHKAASEAVPDETISIPLEARGKPLAMFPVSVRLQQVFEFKRFRLVGELHAQSAKSEKPERATNANLRGLGHGG